MISRYLLFYYSFSLLLLVGCAAEDSKKEVEISQPLKMDQLVNWTFFNEEAFHNISFPIWFSNDIIKTDSISDINISIYRFQENQNTELPKDTFPDEIWRFAFNKEGWVKEVVLEEYSEAILIAEHQFDYKENPDSLGYSSPNVSTKYLFKENQNSIQGIFDQVEDLKVFDRLVFESMDSIAITYKNALSTLKEKHVFITDTNSWNVHFIDEHFKANGTYLYYFGYPNHYYESFKLNNLVDKTLKQRKTFYENGVIKILEHHDGGFYSARNFIYDEEGLCTTFKDSIFSSGEEFVNAERSIIKFKKHQLPQQVLVYAMDDTLKKNQKSKYEFSYSYNTK